MAFSISDVNMYIVAPIALYSAEEAAQFREAYLKVILTFWATIVAAALAVALLAAVSAASLRMIEWCSAELTPFSCRLYLSGI